MPAIANAQKIPPKIHFIFLAKKERMPDIFNYCVNVAKKLHPNWEINFYNEEDASLIIHKHFPELEKLYHSYPLNVQRADIFRILVVYLYGGFYLDLDVYCLKKLDSLLKFNVVLGEEKQLKREACAALELKNPKRIANYMFGSIAGHPFWLDFLNEIIEKSLIEIRNENDVLESTGPGLLTDFYHSKADFYKDIVLLSNKDRLCLNELHKEIACHFGNYAAHLHAGTWRWQNGQTPKFNDINKKKGPPDAFENSFRYQIENNNYQSFYFNEETSGIEPRCNNELVNALKKIGNAINNLADVNNEKVVLYGPVVRYMYRVLPLNTYIYCDSSFNVDFSNAEIDFINNNFKCCIVPTARVKAEYELNGIKVNIQIIEPGFQRYKRDLKGERTIEEFKLGCLAASFNLEMFKELLQACNDLRKGDIPSIKIKLYDPNAKFKELYPEFEELEVIEYTSLVISEDFFSHWFKDLAAAILGSSIESSPAHALEFLYLGIPIIIPDNDNYKDLLGKLIANRAIILSYVDNKAERSNGNFTSKNIKKSILNLYNDYDHYSTNALNVSEELEDIQTIEETEQNILRILSEI